jgi:hypothetical protein
MELSSPSIILIFSEFEERGHRNNNDDCGDDGVYSIFLAENR